MADLSGVCDAHGIVVFNPGDGVWEGPDLEGVNYVERDLVVPDKWYWATVQHMVLTGKPNGHTLSRAAALADAAGVIKGI